MELQYYEYLMKLQESGEISRIELQPSMVIIKAYQKYGRTIRKAVYTSDFLVFYPDESHKYIEVKGMSDPAADLRRKLWDSQYPDELIWVTGVDCRNGKYTRWVEYDLLKKERRVRRKEKQKNAKV